MTSSLVHILPCGRYQWFDTFCYENMILLSPVIYPFMDWYCWRCVSVGYLGIKFYIHRMNPHTHIIHRLVEMSFLLDQHSKIGFKYTFHLNVIVLLGVKHWSQYLQPFCKEEFVLVIEVPSVHGPEVLYAYFFN